MFHPGLKQLIVAEKHNLYTMLVYAMAARNDVNLNFFMSLLEHILTLIDRKLEKLNPQEQIDIHYLLAKNM